MYCFPYCRYDICRFVHAKDSWGDDIDTTMTSDELARAFDDLGQIEGDIIDQVIKSWKSDPTTNHVFASGSRVLFSPYFVTVLTIILFSLVFCF